MYYVHFRAYEGKGKAKVKEQYCNSFAQFDSTVWLHTGGTEAWEWVGGRKNSYINK